MQHPIIRLMFILEVLLSPEFKQGDVTAVFVHVNLDEGEEVYVHVPKRF